RPVEGSSSPGFKFSADVKPFVPKYTTVTVAWSEPSEACVFPTTYYPRVQEPSCLPNGLDFSKVRNFSYVNNVAEVDIP
uniref:Uncharacterized protein n=1 Tax=Terrapene triunguis TaxID=2587831 RepID=A0A674JVN6_9SAUR